MIKFELQKEVDIRKDKAIITLKVKVDRPKGYKGLDVFPDKSIADLFLAVSRQIKRQPVKEIFNGDNMGTSRT